MKEQDFKAVFGQLETEDIERYIYLAKEEITKRKNAVAQTMWEKVVDAITEYEQEVGEIRFTFDYSEYYNTFDLSYKNVGKILLQNE